MWHEQFKRRHVINLRSRPDRRSHVQAELARLGVSFDFFDAVQGKDNPLAGWLYRSVLKQSTPLNPGALGCFLSHAMIWMQTILDARVAPDDFVLLMEDDLVWHDQTTNDSVQSLLRRVPKDANMIKFSVCDFTDELPVLEQRKQIQAVADGVYLQTGMLGSTLMYAVRKSVLPAMLGFTYPSTFDNTIVPQTYLLLPYPKGVLNRHTKNFHFGVCYQGDSPSDVVG